MSESQATPDVRAEFDRGLMALALEVPREVWDDFRLRSDRLLSRFETLEAKLWARDEQVAADARLLGAAQLRLRAVEEALRDHRQILKAWGLGDADKMAVLMLGAFLREFGKAPDAAALAGVQAPATLAEPDAAADKGAGASAVAGSVRTPSGSASAEVQASAPHGDPIPGPDPGACPKCGVWRKAGMLHECEAGVQAPAGEDAP